jgi:uncharacterized ferredoxin-like protein
MIMAVIRGDSEGVLESAKLMLVSARTAPKTAGVDDVESAIVTGEEKDRIAEEMERMAQDRGVRGFIRDAGNVRDSEAVVLIGINGRKSSAMNCGSCGYRDCKAFDSTEERKGNDFVGPNCIFKAIDLGIALGSAVKTASLLNVDNRIMYRIGTAAVRLGLMEKSTVVLGIPLSAKGKSIYFDRKFQ